MAWESLQLHNGIKLPSLSYDHTPNSNLGSRTLDSSDDFTNESVSDNDDERCTNVGKNTLESLDMIVVETRSSESSMAKLKVTFESSPEILRRVIESNYLNYKEIGRLLLLVSKSTAATSFLCDDVWRSLLCNRFGVTIASEMMDNLNCGPHKCFRHLLKTEPDIEKIKRFAPCEYRIIINIYDDMGNRLLFKIFSGDALESFFEDGYAEMKGTDGIKYPVYARYSGLFRMKATVHIIRIQDQKSICIIDGRTGLNEYNLDRRTCVFTTSMSPAASSLNFMNNNASHLGSYFNLRMKIRKTTSGDVKCSDGCNVALYGKITLEAMQFPTCELFQGYRARNGGPVFSEILDSLPGWS